MSGAEPHPRSLKHLDALLERQPSGTPLLQEFYRDREIYYAAMESSTRAFTEWYLDQIRP